MDTVWAMGDRHKDFMRGTGQGGELDKNAFLELLITQLRYQDPLKPSDNGEFLAQMAQFTSLEQVQNINEGINKLLSGQGQYQERLLEAMEDLNAGVEHLIFLAQMSGFDSFDRELQLLGKEVTLKRTDGGEVTGRVTAVNFSQGSPRLVVGDETFDLAQLVKVSSGDTG